MKYILHFTIMSSATFLAYMVVEPVWLNLAGVLVLGFYAGAGVSQLSAQKLIK